MFIYVISVSLQIAGGIILLLNFGNVRERFIKTYFPGSNFVLRDEQNQCLLDDSKVKQTLKKIYLNTLSICNIVLGYLIAIWSENTPNKVSVFVFTIISTIILLFIDNRIAAFFAKQKLPEYLHFYYDELEKYGVESPATTKEALEYLNMK